MQFTIFGKLSCVTPRKNDCSDCSVKAAGLEVTFLLYNNDFSSETAKEWEKKVFIKNIKSFNKAMNTSYHTDLQDNLEYNQTLINQLQNVANEYRLNGTNLLPLKLDFMAERSIPDNIVEETSENTFVIVFSYILMFFYVGCALGHIPSPIYSKFSLGFAGIIVVISALVSAIGITFYFDEKLTMISAEVVPFLILAIGVDNIFLISRAERVVPEYIQKIDLRIALAL